MAPKRRRSRDFKCHLQLSRLSRQAPSASSNPLLVPMTLQPNLKRVARLDTRGCLLNVPRCRDFEHRPCSSQSPRDRHLAQTPTLAPTLVPIRNARTETRGRLLTIPVVSSIVFGTKNTREKAATGESAIGRQIGRSNMFKEPGLWGIVKANLASQSAPAPKESSCCEEIEARFLTIKKREWTEETVLSVGCPTKSHTIMKKGTTSVADVSSTN